jgi:CIC family chloride channel protein
MRRDPQVIAEDLPVAELRQRFPAGSTKQVFVVDGNGGLIGIVDPAEASRGDVPRDGWKVGDLVEDRAPFLMADENLRTALIRFGETAQEALPVIDDREHKRVIGYLSEAYALRRYAQELEHRRSVVQDDAGIFSPATGKDAAGPNPQNP